MCYTYETVGNVIVCRDRDCGWVDLFIHDDYGNLIPFYLNETYLHFTNY